MANITKIVGAYAAVSLAGVAAKGISNFFNKGALPTSANAATVNFTNASGQKITADTRVKIRVPNDYLGYLTGGFNSELTMLGGIIFPYTPSITYEQKADYATSSPLHSNFPINFYQKSTITPISISGKFTVQNDKDAGVYLSTLHMLRALTKMKTGGGQGVLVDADAGSPPPVCRLDAHGPFMLDNVPVAITSFRVELPDSVDYYTTGKSAQQRYGQTSVPTISTIAITCIPMYSRAEMQDYSVSGWLYSPGSRKAGYL